MTTKPLYELYNGSQLVFETPDDGYSYFFGYYDKSPLNRNNTLLLAHRVAFDGRDVKEGDEAEVGYFELATSKYHVIGKTKAFNWQQGSHLQWLPPAFDQVILYNDCRDGKFVCIRYDLEAHQEKVIPFPIYAVHPSGAYALAVNYERLYYCRPGYRYFGVINPKWDAPYQEDDGIFKVDLETGDVDQLISTADIVRMNPLPVMEREYNWLEHMMWNPSGTRFMFMHRWNEKDKCPTRVYTCDYDGMNIKMYPDNLFYSHYSWKSNDKLSIWTNLQNGEKAAFKVIKDGVKSLPGYRFARRFCDLLMPADLKKKLFIMGGDFITYNDLNGSYTREEADLLNGYGHTTWLSEKSEILMNDTYQDCEEYRYLMIHKLDYKSTLILGRFKSLYNDCGYRCDLHPRNSLSNEFVVIDSAHYAKRKIFVISYDLK